MTKSTISSIGAAVLAVCGFVADAPPELQNQIPQVFPEHYRGYLSIIFMIAAYAVHNYGAVNRVLPPPGSSEASSHSLNPLDHEQTK